MKVSRRRFASHAGLTWIECLVILGVLAALLSMLSRYCGPTPKGVQMMRMVSNMKQLHLATQSLALDGMTAEKPFPGWPGDRGGTFSNWAASLAPDYLSPNDLRTSLSALERTVTRRDPLITNSTAVLVYAAKEESPGDVVFLSSANFTNTPEGGLLLLTNAVPFGTNGFVVFRKGGDSAVLKAKQVGQTNVIGAFAPLCR